MGARKPKPARRFDQALTWASLGYGIFCAAFYATHTRDELEIAFGVEMILISLLDFMWARARQSLGIGLIVAGVSAPVIGIGSAPLFWHDARLFAGDGFFTPLLVGIVGGAPLVWLGVRTLKHGAVTPRTPDPEWLTPVRWALKAGLWLIVLAFRLGDFRSGTVLVYIGAALALCSLALGLPRRLAMGKSGVGRLLAFIGVSALFITLVAGVAVGGHMSRDEQMLGIAPSLLLIAVGVIVTWRSAK